MNIGILVVAIVVGYLLGAVSFARIVARIADPSIDLEDVRIPSDVVPEGRRLNAISARSTSVRNTSARSR